LQYEEREQPYPNVRESRVGRRYDTDPTVHKWLFNPKEVLSEVEKYLRGQVYDPKTKSWKQVRHALLNEDGIQTILLLLSPYASKVFSMSHLTEERIKQMVYEFNNDMIILIGTDLDNSFELDQKHRSLIIRLIGDMVYATLRKALEGLSLGIIRDTTEAREVINPRQGGGLFGFLRRGR